jgi:hypothetical protein
METKTTSCNPALCIDLLDTNYEMDEALYNNNIPITLHLDTRIISWSKVSKYLGFPHVS